MMDKMPMDAAKECAQRFPIKETIDTVTVEDLELLKAYEEEFMYMSQMIDSLLNAKCDTLYVDKIKEKISKIPCKPDVKYIIKTQESTSKLEALQAECDKKQKELVTNFNKSVTDFHALKDKYDKLQTRNIWLWIIVVLLSIYSFRKLFR
jgi:hypothetical protein